MRNGLCFLLQIISVLVLNAQQIDYSNPDQELINSLTLEEKAFLKAHPVIKAANQEGWPPFDYVEDGVPKGYCIEHIQLLANKLGLGLEFVSDYRWVSLYELLKEQKIDVMPILYWNSQREPYTLYTEPYIRTTLSLYSIEENIHLTSLKDLKRGVKVGVHQGDACIPYMQTRFPDIELVEFPGSKEIVKALASRKVDAIVENSLIFHYTVKRYQVYNLKLVDFIEPGNASLNPSMYIGVRTGLPVLHSILQKAMHRVTPEEKQLLHKKWLGDITDVNREVFLTQEEKAYLAQKKSIEMCVNPSMMPFDQIDETGKHNGISAEIIQIISEIIDKPVELITTETWQQTTDNIKSKKCDIIPIIVNTTKRSEYMHFTKPYITESVVIVTKEDEFFVEESSELKNRKIGVVEGYVYIELLKQKHPSIDIVAVKNAKYGLEKVQKGELFGFVDILPTIAYTIQNNGMFDLKVAGRLEFDAQFCIASRKDEPLLNSIMQKALEHISEEQINSIVHKWVAIKVEQSFDYRNLIYISLFFLSILLVFIFKNRSINKINKELEQAYREKDKFFSIIAHDLKGPIGNFSCLLNTVELNNIDEELYSHLRSSASNTYELLLELLTWSRVQKKQLEINPTNFNIKQVFKKTVSSLQLSANRKDVQLLLPDENNAVYVYADIPTINTVVRNLVANAIKFTNPGGTVSLQTEHVKNTIRIFVTDTGVGMTDEIISKLFKLGKDVSSPGTMGERGTGLGLLLCKEFIELNKGKIEVESRLGKGSTFCFNLPAGKKTKEENLLEIAKEKQLEALIVEDNFLNLQNTINELNKAGVDYEVANNGNEGCKKGQEKEYDFVLLDIDLPNKNGIEVNKEIRSKFPSANIISLSSYDKYEIHGMDNSVVFNDYLKKPIKIEDLLYCLKKLKCI